MPEKVWAKWTSTKKDGSVVNLRIEEAEKDRFGDVVDILDKHFLHSENFTRAAGVYKRDESKQELLNMFSLMLGEDSVNCCICCLDEESDSTSPILGVSIMGIVDDAYEEYMKKLLDLVRTPEVIALMKLIKTLNVLCDVKERLGVEKLYAGRGILVIPEYRGLGIAKKFIETRRLICVEQSIPATEATMSAIGTQKAAESDAWNTLFEIPFEELGKLVGVEFDKAPPLCKIMAVKVDIDK